MAAAGYLTRATFKGLSLVLHLLLLLFRAAVDAVDAGAVGGDVARGVAIFGEVTTVDEVMKEAEVEDDDDIFLI
jgi:hypothetical protein